MGSRFCQTLNTTMTHAIKLEVLPEDVPVRGNALASGDDRIDEQCENAILARLAAGDPWAWCIVRVTVQAEDGREESEFLGGCSYANEAEFRAGGYFDDMVKSCLERLNS